MPVLAPGVASIAGGVPGAFAKAGQTPTSLASARKPWRWPPASAISNKGITAGFWLRWSNTGMLAVHAEPCHICVPWAEVSTISGVSGNNSRVLPCSAAGRPLIENLSCLPLTSTVASPPSGFGWAFRWASNAAALSAVEPRTGTRSANSPSSGTHSLRHTNQAAFSLMSRSPLTEGLKSGVMVSGTASNAVPSKP